MNRREFIRRGIYLAGAFACLPSGLALADLDAAEGLSISGDLSTAVSSVVSVTITPAPPWIKVEDLWKRQGEILRVERIDANAAYLVPAESGALLGHDNSLWTEIFSEMKQATVG